MLQGIDKESETCGIIYYMQLEPVSEYEALYVSFVLSTKFNTFNPRHYIYIYIYTVESCCNNTDTLNCYTMQILRNVLSRHFQTFVEDNESSNGMPCTDEIIRHGGPTF